VRYAALPHDRPELAWLGVLPFDDGVDAFDEAGADEIALPRLAVLDERDVLGVQQHEGSSRSQGREERVEQRELVALVLNPVTVEVHQVSSALLERVVELDAPRLDVALVFADHHPAKRRDLEAVGGHPLRRTPEMRVRPVLVPGVYVRSLAREGLGAHEPSALSHARRHDIDLGPREAGLCLLAERVLVVLDVLENRARVVRARRCADPARPVRVVPGHADGDVMYGQFDGAGGERWHVVSSVSRMSSAHAAGLADSPPESRTRRSRAPSCRRRGWRSCRSRRSAR